MKNNECFKEFIKYTLLNVLGTVGVSCYILADTLFISRGMGSNGLTALNLAIPVYSLIYGTGLMLGIGGATRYAIAKGEGNNEKADSVFTSTIGLSIIFSFIYMAAGLFFPMEIAKILGADQDVLEMTGTYLNMLLCFAPAFLLNNIMVSFIRNDNNPRLAMAATITGSLANVLLDYIFIFPLNMGIFGAILATVMSPVISIFVSSLHLIKKQNDFHFRLSLFRPFIALSCMSTGTAGFITELANGIVVIIFNMLILRLNGNTGVAAYSVITNTAIVATAILSGISQGMQPIISRSYGEGNYRSIMLTLKYGLIATIILSIAFYSAALLFAEPIASLFNGENNAELQKTAVNGIRIYFFGLLFAGLNILMSNYFASVKKAFPAMLISLLKGFILIIPTAMVLSETIGIEGVWMSYPCAEAVTALTAAVLFLRFGYLKLKTDK